MSKSRYQDSKGDIIALGLFAAAVIALVAMALWTAPAKAFPSDWKDQGKTCADAGKRPGTSQDAYCPAPNGDGCVPCPRTQPIQVRQTGGRKPA